MKNFDSGETFQLEAGVQSLEGLERLHVIAERQRRMESAHDVQLGNAQRQRLPRKFDHFFGRVLKAIRVALLAGKGAELATQDTVIGVVEITIEDVTGAI